jgi:uncharacterized repeat protein (TIGR01451 family)
MEGCLMRKLIITFIVGLALVLSSTVMAVAAGTPEGTAIENKAFADYQDANGNQLPRVESNTVTTTVNQVAGVSVTPDAATKAGDPSTPVVFSATVTNTGNGGDSFALTASSVWPTDILIDDNGNGVKDAAETTTITDTGSLLADGFLNVLVVVDVPGGTANATNDNTTFTATSAFDGTVIDTGTYTVNVEDAVMTLQKSVDTANGSQPGDIVTYAVTGSNSGSTDAESAVVTDQIPANTIYVPGSMRFGAVGGTYDAATPLTDANDGDGADFDITTPGAVTYNWGTAVPGATGVVYFRTAINNGVAASTVISNVANLDYSVGGNPQPTQDSNTQTFQVDSRAGVQVTPSVTTRVGDPDDEIVFPLTVTNTGNGLDTINLTTSSSAGLTWVLWRDVNGDGELDNGDTLLADTSGNGDPDTGPIGPGTNVAVLSVATIPTGANNGGTDTLVVTGTSSAEPGVTDTSGNLTTTVTAPVMALLKTADKATAQPGEDITYTSTATNNGSGVATDIIISDPIPLFTTYVPGSIETGTSLANLESRSDADDGDGGHFDPNTGTVLANTPTVGAGGSFILRFRVTVD